MNKSRLTIVTGFAQLPAGAFRSRRRGTVLVITLIAVILIAALLAYVLNIGRQANSRIVVQNAADATAISGAGWVARTLNTVAMNNVSIARLISLVNVLDAMPQAIDFTLKDQQALHNAIRDQVAGASGRNGVVDPWVHDALTSENPRMPAGTLLTRQANFQPLLDEIKNEIDLINPVNEALNRGSFDMREMTYYSGPSGRGQIWLAMESLDTISQSMVENLAILSQTNAVLAGLGNTGHDGNYQSSYTAGFSSNSHGAALLLPVTPTIPLQRGTFEDFDRPVMHGLLPSNIDNKTTNRGPYDTIFGWREPIGPIRVGGVWVPGNPGTSGGHGNVPIGRGAGGGGNPGHWAVPPTAISPDAYRVFGPHGWLLRQISNIQRDQLRRSRFGHWVGQMASIKLSYLWPGDPTQQLVDPDWVTDVASVYQTAQNAPSTIVETCFVAVELKSRYARTDPNFLTPGSFCLDEPLNNDLEPRIVRMGGWSDPRVWTVPQVNNAIWRDEWVYQTPYDSSIGLLPKTDPVTGQAVMQNVFRIDEFMLVGINVGKKVDIRSPHNFSSRSGLPAPINADPSFTNSPDARLKYLTYLGVALKPDEGLMWGTKFGGGKVEPANFGVAQAKVFNDHSWDLWTQMWRVQLEPVSDFSNWTAQVDSVAQSPPAGLITSPQNVATFQQYLHSVEGLAPVMLSH